MDLSSSNPPASSRSRPLLAFISNTQAPYKLTVQKRIAREIPEIELHCLFTIPTHPDSPWLPTNPPEINPLVLTDRMPPADFRRFQMQAWNTGGRVVHWLKQHHAAAVIAQGYADLGMLRVIAWCARNGVPCLLSGDSNIRADHSRGLRRWIKTRYLRWLVRKSAAILPFGTNGRAYFARYGAMQEQIFHFPMEPDYQQISQLSADEISRISGQFELDPSRRRLVFSGRLVEVKRVDLLIDAFAAIAAARPQWDLVIVGDGPLREELRQRVPRHAAIARSMDGIRFGSRDDCRHLSRIGCAGSSEPSRAVGIGGKRGGGGGFGGGVQ